MSNAMKTSEGFFGSQRIKLILEGFHIDSILDQMLQRVEDWLECDDEGSTFIWLQGPPKSAEDHQNGMSLLAAKLTELAWEFKSTHEESMPLVSYFCSISSQDLREGNPSREAEGVVSLVYAFLHQFLAAIHSFHSTDASKQSLLSALEQQISGLDGTVRTWSEALSAFDQAARLVTPDTVCVIDGLHWLDGRDTDDLLSDLVRLLRKTSFRVLFTTSGTSGALLEHMNPEDCVEMDEE
ncbi:hypothetical protein LRP88_04483 [Fusarium phalaenopsidis]